MQLELQWQVNQWPQTFNVIDERPIVVGRRRDCDIVLTDKMVSRQHAEIYVDQGAFQLHNLSRTNPVYIYTRQKLMPGQSISLKSCNAFQLGLVSVRIKSLREHPQLQILKLIAQLSAYRINGKKPIILGRDETCDLILDNRTVSRQHAKIFVQRGRFKLQNLSETSAIYVYARQRLLQGEVKPLNKGDIFRVGQTQIRTQSHRERADERADELADLYKVRCPGCQRKVTAALKDCVWCGAGLACGTTTY